MNIMLQLVSHSMTFVEQATPIEGGLVVNPDIAKLLGSKVVDESAFIQKCVAYAVLLITRIVNNDWDQLIHLYETTEEIERMLTLEAMHAMYTFSDVVHVMQKCGATRYSLYGGWPLVHGTRSFILDEFFFESEQPGDELWACLDNFHHLIKEDLKSMITLEPPISELLIAIEDNAEVRYRLGVELYNLLN